MKHVRTRGTNIALLAVVLVLLGLLGYGIAAGIDRYKFDRDDRYSVAPEATLLEPKSGTVEAGGVLIYSRPYACNRGVDVRVERSLELDNTGFRQDFGWVEFSANTAAQTGEVDENGCVTPSIQTIRLPASLLPGIWRIRFDASWQSYGGVKTVRTYSPWFEVTR